MRTKELNERSPLRVLEKSIHGGLGRGNLGVLVARHGVGKTAFLVGVALDDLMRGRKVLHVALDQTIDKTLGYYDEVFAELAHERELEDVWRVRAEMERNRRIHAYLDGSFSIERLREAISFMRTHGDFAPAAIILEGLDFEKLAAADLQALRELAATCDAELWMSATTHRDAPRDGRGIPAPVSSHAAELDVILTMAHDGNNVHVSVLKDHDSAETAELKLALDPTTMLLVKESGAQL